MTLTAALPLVVSVAGTDDAIREWLAIAVGIDGRLTIENAHHHARAGAVVSMHWRLEGTLQTSEVELGDLLSGEAGPAYRATLASSADLEYEARQYIREAGIRRATLRRRQPKLPGFETTKRKKRRKD